MFDPTKPGAAVVFGFVTVGELFVYNKNLYKKIHEAVDEEGWPINCMVAPGWIPASPYDHPQFFNEHDIVKIDPEVYNNA